jgi:hypothetical protein
MFPTLCNLILSGYSSDSYEKEKEKEKTYFQMFAKVSSLGMGGVGKIYNTGKSYFI